MKLGTSTEPLKCSAPLEKAAFQLGNSAVLIKILRQQLYTDPIQAITQEVMSNARDAHRELGNADVPIEVRLPTRMKPEFSVRDFGVGISPDRMTDVFIKYGESTKRADNIQTGGFGIGAKTPLAYSDQFTIETFYPDDDGQVWRRRYLAAIDSNEIGDLHFIGEAEPTDEPRGTKISLTVKPGDERRFINGVRRAASFWDPRPRILGITEEEIDWEEINPSLEGDGWMILSKNPVRPMQRRAIALVDGIPYALSYNSIVGDDDDGQGLRLAFDLDFALTLEVGEVNVTASREGLEYTPEATNTIRKRITSMMSELTRDAISRVKNQTDLWKAYEAWWSLPEVVRGYVKAQNGGKPLKWNNIPLHREFQLPAGAHIFEYSRVYRDTGMGTTRTTKKTFHPGRLMDSGMLFIHDDNTKTPPRARAMSLFHQDTITFRVSILVLPNGIKDLNDPTVPLQDSEDHFGLLTYAKELEKFSSVPKYYPPRRSGGAIPALKTFRGNAWRETNLDFKDEDDVVFVQLYRNRPHAAEGLRCFMSDCDISSAQNILSVQIVGVQTPFIKKVPDTWKWLKTRLHEVLEERLQDAEVQKAFATPTCDNLFAIQLSRLESMVVRGKIHLPEGGILNQWRDFAKDCDHYEKIRRKTTSLAMMIGKSDKLPGTRTENSIPFMEIAQEKLPLLFAYEDNYSAVPTPAKEIQWYIDQKDVPAADPKEDKDIQTGIDRKAWEMREHESNSWREIERALGLPDHNGNAARRAAKRHEKTMSMASAAD
jgi:hypothetical protein